MKKPQNKQARIYQALTIIKRGRLSKTHLADPKEGLAEEDKKAQETPVKVALIPVAELDPATCEEVDGGTEQEHTGRPEVCGAAGADNAGGGRTASKPKAGQEDEFSHPDDVDGNVA
jgi:hypothetical protein